MSYMYSNEPYNRQDGLLNGGLIGGAMGGLGYYSAKTLNSAKKIKGLSPEQQKSIANVIQEYLQNEKGKNLFTHYRESQNKTHQAIAEMNKDYANSRSFKVFGRGKNRAIAAGASILAGGLLGMGIDAMHKSSESDYY